MDENFLLHCKPAQQLYHEFAKSMPIIDYHNHLPPDQIANNINFENITQAWLYGDHYKWRAMRTNGVDEKYCTGNASDWEKFQQWAITVPYTFPGYSVHDELGLLVKAGLTPMKALETATTNPALILGLSKTWGRVETGYSANLVLLDADPLADIANTTKIDAVVVNGKFLDRARLGRMLHAAKAPAAPRKSVRP